MQKAAHQTTDTIFPPFQEWIRPTIREHQMQHPDIDKDLYLLSVPPRMAVQSYKRMKAFGNHFRVTDEEGLHSVSYDSGLISVFEQHDVQQGRGWMQMGYVGELTGIWVLNYGTTSQPVILMKGAWVRPDWQGGRPSMKRDSDGFLMANFNQRMPEWSEPFVFPSQVEQAFFLEVEESPGWRVVCHSQPRVRRMEGTKVEFSLDAHDAFDVPRVHVVHGTSVGRDYIPLTMRETYEGEVQFENVADDGNNVAADNIV